MFSQSDMEGLSLRSLVMRAIWSDGGHQEAGQLENSLGRS
jgi:hypothetical protein